jgi:tRNA modification GTPase
MKPAVGRRPPTDTIAAVATAPGRSAVGIVRVSGPAVEEVCAQLLGQVPPPRHASLLDFNDAEGRAIDRGIALYFPAPNSYTGEEMLELQGHGNAVILELLQQRLQQLGVRSAAPGEFSARAFLNGKIDLAQAEAISDLVASDTAQAARAALASLQGEFSRIVLNLAARIDRLRAELEAWLDFPEEDPQIAALQDYSARTRAIIAEVEQAMRRAREGQILRDGLRIVLAGRPNAGKSSLFNRLLQRDRAIVSEIPGTTRDTLEAAINLRGVSAVICDTAGLRDASDSIEQEGMRRTRALLREADHILLLVPANEQLSDDDAEVMSSLGEQATITVVRTKIDLTDDAATLNSACNPPQVHLSALSGEGLPLLEQRLQQALNITDAGEGVFTARRRHVAALQEVRDALLQAMLSLAHSNELEVAAEYFRRARAALSAITGEYTTEDMLGEIFSSFCIGK